MSTSTETMPTFYTVAFAILLALSLINFAWSTWKTLKEDLRHLRRLHQIPCDRCVFFTGEHNLKCTVHPSRAFHEEAIDCPDYRSIKPR
jgi:hypothetical protein